MIRPLAPGDDIAGHVARIYAEHGMAYDPAFEDDLLDPAATYAHGAFWVWDEGGIVGTIGVLPHGGCRIIKRLYVAASGRGRGVARGLLGAAFSWGPFRRTELWSDVRLSRAHRLYMALGFVAGPTRILEDPDRSVERYFSRDDS